MDRVISGNLKSRPEKMLAFSILASGSKGNAILISDGKTSILLDAGLSGIEIERRMKVVGFSPDRLDAILVSHEHSDHVKGVGILSRRYQIPVYISRETEKVARPALGALSETLFFECGNRFGINSIEIRPFSISHDAADPAGFTFSKDNLKIGVVTDLGIATSMVKTHLEGCKALIIEANHDPGMLMEGPYPWPLKQRVKGRTGHLSNPESRNLLKELMHEELSHVVLAHLSEINNTPEKAILEVGSALDNKRTKIIVASQDSCSELFRLQCS